MKTVKELIKKHAVWSEDLNQDVIPVSNLEQMIAEFESKSFESRLADLDKAMKQLGSMLNTSIEEQND